MFFFRKEIKTIRVWWEENIIFKWCLRPKVAPKVQTLAGRSNPSRTSPSNENKSENFRQTHT